MEPGLQVSNLGPGRVGLRVKALTRLFDPDSCSMLLSISFSKTAQSQCTVANKPVHLQNTGSVRVNLGHGSLAFRVGSRVSVTDPVPSLAQVQRE